MRVTVKNTCCPFCAGELVVEGDKLTCIDGHELNDLDWHRETAAKIQPVIDWVKSIDGDRQ